MNNMNSPYRSYGQWSFIKCLGRGGFGEVILWINQNTKQEIAVKSLKETGNLSCDIQHSIEKRWRQEHQWMQNLKTSSIVGSVQVDDNDFLNYLNANHAWHPLPVIVMEYCNGGDLRAQLLQVDNFNGLAEFEVREVLRCLRQAIDYLHNVCRIEHRDLKPDNIVMHRIGHKRIYKLTDFGLARAITDNTNLKSCVGTGSYLAPEIITTSKYKENVDYWSLGVIAFELMCGCLPFIPHQGMKNIIENIAKKPYTAVAITERFTPSEKPPADDVKPVFVFEAQMFAENFMSSVFRQAMEQFLQTTFDTNYMTRGTRPCSPQNPNRSLTFYHELDRILESKILSVFHLNTQKFYYFEVSEGMRMAALLDEIERQTKMPKVNGYIVFPTGHKPGKLTRDSTPLDLYMSEWLDTRDALNPPAMLYLVNLQGDYEPPTPHVSVVIKKCMSLVAEDYLPEWYLDKFERHVHYLIATEELSYRAFLSGLKDYALVVEHEVLEFKPYMGELHASISVMLGRVEQFAVSVRCAKEAYESESNNYRQIFALYEDKSHELHQRMSQISHNIGQIIEKRFNSVLRRIKELVTTPMFDILADKDPFQIFDFRKNLFQLRRHGNRRRRLDFAQKSVHLCLNTLDELSSNKAVISARMNISQIHQEFIRIKAIVRGTQTNCLTSVGQEVNQATLAMHTDLRDAHAKYNDGHLSHTMESLNLDRMESLHDVFNMPTQTLIQEALESAQQMEIELDEDIPATIPAIFNTQN